MTSMGGYRSVADGDDPLEIGFVGRDADLSWARRVLDGARTEGVRVGLIGGEPGVGKSRLLREIVRAAEADGWQPVIGRCSRIGPKSHPPFGTVLLPVLREAGLWGTESLEPAVLDMGQFAAEISRATLKWSEHRPVIVVVDDLQDAAAGTQGLFTEFIRNLTDSGRSGQTAVAVLGAHHLGIRGDQIGRLATELGREHTVLKRELAGLSEVEVHALLEKVLGLGCEATLLEEILTGTRGNPFLVTDVARTLLESGSLVPRNGLYGRPSGSSTAQPLVLVPDSISSRIAELGPDVLETLGAAAVLGDTFKPNQLAAFGAGHKTVEARLDECVAAGLIVPVVEGFRFTHGVVARAVLDLVGPLLRERLHLRVCRDGDVETPR